jgi:translation initiation factor IF-3
VGIVSINDALRLAQESDLDLVEVAPTARPPVCKLMDYGKFKYESALKARESRKNQAQTVIKEIKIRPKIDPHDYGTKKGHVERFLKAGDKVKVTIMFRGREQSRPELGYKLLQRLAGDIEELGFVESAPKQDGRNMIMVIGPHRKKADTKPVRAPERERASARAAAPDAVGTHTESFAPFSVSTVPDSIPVVSAAPASSRPQPSQAQPRPAQSRPAQSRPAAAVSSGGGEQASAGGARDGSAAASHSGSSHAGSSAPASDSRSAAPRPASSAASTPRSSAPRPASPRPGPGTAAPRPSAPRPGPSPSGAPRPAPPRPTAPKPGPVGGAPRPTAPKPSAPRATPPQGEPAPVPPPRSTDGPAEADSGG